MKRIITTALICLFALGISTTAQAIVLAPAASIAPAGAAPSVYGSLITSLTLPVVYDSISGSVTQDVYFNATGYLFVYQFSNTIAQGNAVGRFTTTDYSGFYVDADAISATGVMPTLISRSNLGDSVGFDYYAAGGVNPGQTSASMWIQTNAQYYGSGTTHFINGGTKDIVMYGPAVPEPASMVLIGLGLLGLGAGRIRKRFKA